MPQIPTAISTRSLPGTTGETLMPTADPIGAALQHSGLQLEQSANRAQHFLAVREQLRKSNDAQALAFDFSDKTNKIAENLKTAPVYDPETDVRINHEETTKRQIDGLINQYKEKVTDPEVWQYAQKHLMAESHALIATARAKDTQLLVDQAKALTDRQIFEGVREAARPGNTPEQIMEIKGKMVSDILGKVNAGVFKAEFGQALITHLDEQIATEYFAQLGQVDPSKALSLLKDTTAPKEDETTGKLNPGSMAYYLNPQKRNELIAHFDRTAKSQKVTGLLVDLETKHATSPDTVQNLVNALNEAESTEFLKTNGVEVQTAVMANITNKLRRQQQEISIKDNNLASTLNKRMVENTLTYDEIVNSGLSSAGQGVMFRNLRAYTNEQRSLAKQERSLNIAERQEQRIVKQEKSNEIYGQLLARIVSGEEVNPVQIIAQQQEGLLPADSNKLISDIEKIRNNPDLKAAYKVIDDKFLKVDPVKASQMKKDIYAANIQAGVTGTALIERANTAVKSGKESVVSKLLNNAFNYMGETAKINIKRINRETSTGTQPQSSGGIAIGTTATNPKTKQTVTWDGTAWK